MRYRADADGDVRFSSTAAASRAREWALGLGLASLMGGVPPALADASIAPPGHTGGEHGSLAPAPANPPTEAPKPKPPKPDQHVGRPPRKPPVMNFDDDVVLGKLAY